MASEQGALLQGRLMQLYVENAGLDNLALERTALRSESIQMRNILACAASHGTLNFSELSTQVLHDAIAGHSLQPEALGRLAYVVALQNVEPADTAFAAKSLEIALPSVSGADVKRLSKLLAELYFEQRRFAELDILISQRPEVRRHYHSYLSVDSRNPFVRTDLDDAAHRRWLREFNWQFTRNDLAPVFLREGEDVPFNRLASAPAQPPQPEGPLVTVIMTCYKPERGDAIQAARSILEQTWTNLELLIVDDASPTEYADVIDRLQHLDQRVRVIRLSANAGTYAARNAGIAHAQGEFITGQDSDDWSHPQRIETQVNDLLQNPQRPGNQVYTVNMTEDLVRIRRGYSPFIPSAPTLMVRTRILRELGGYLPARKASDNEMRDRVSAYAGRPVHPIPEPLIFMRIQADSLSRADFRPGWQHPARRAFWSSYRTWHTTASKAELRRRAHQPAPIHIPPRFTAPPGETVELDVVFAADWCEHGEPQAAALKEIRQLLASGCRVGVLHLENAIHLSRYARTYTQPVQELISKGQVAHVMADEPFYDAKLVLVRTPELLQFMPHGRVAFTVRAVAVVAGEPAWQSDGFVVRYLPGDCSRHSEEFFGVRPLWLPTTPAVRGRLHGLVPSQEIRPVNYITPFDPATWAVPRRRPNRRQVTIGRWAGETAWQWPQSADRIFQLWPADGRFDVRFYGDPSTLLSILGQKTLPPAWLSFEAGEVSRRTYYRSLDYFVHFPQQRYATGVELPVLEAMAAGCVAVLPPWLQPVYGGAAVYAEPEDVADTLDKYSIDPDLFMKQSRLGVEFARGHRSSEYRELLDPIGAADHTTAQEEST